MRNAINLVSERRARRRRERSGLRSLRQWFVGLLLVAAITFTCLLKVAFTTFGRKRWRTTTAQPKPKDWFDPCCDGEWRNRPVVVTRLAELLRRLVDVAAKRTGRCWWS